MDIEIRVLEEGDDQVLSRVAPEVFDHPVDPALAAGFLADPRHHLAVALQGDVVIGMASAVDYLHPDKPRQLWVNEIGVTPDHRRRGIGRQLLEALMQRGRSLGCGEAWVATESENAAACALYAGSGGKEETAVIYSFDLRGDTE